MLTIQKYYTPSDVSRVSLTSGGTDGGPLRLTFCPTCEDGLFIQFEFFDAHTMRQWLTAVVNSANAVIDFSDTHKPVPPDGIDRGVGEK